MLLNEKVKNNLNSSNEINDGHDGLKGGALTGKKKTVEESLKEKFLIKKELMEMLKGYLDFLSKMKDEIKESEFVKKVEVEETVRERIRHENIRKEMFLYFYPIEQAEKRKIKNEERQFIHQWIDLWKVKLVSIVDVYVATLFYAVFLCDVDVEKKILLDECNKRQTMLSSAAGLLSEDILKILIEKLNHNVNMQATEDSITPLHTAALMGKLKNVELLLEKGADTTIKDKNGNTPLHRVANVNMKFLEKDNKNIKQDMIDIAKALVAKGASAECPNKEGYTAFHRAAKADNVDMIRLFLKKGMQDHIGGKGETALHLAVSSGHQETVAYLVEQGADPCIKDEEGRTPLYRALVANQPGIINIFILNNSLNKKDEEGNTVFHLAAEKGDINIMALLVGIAGKLQLNYRNNNRETPLHLAAAFGHVEAVRSLIKDEANLINAKDVNGYTPLWRAVLAGHYEVARALNPNQQDECGNTLLHGAAMCNGENIVDFLIKVGADINIKNTEGHTPLECALLANHHQIVSKLNLNQQDEDGNTPLHLAVRAGKGGRVDCLMKARADINIKNKEGQTPLDCALAGDCADIVRQLGPNVQDEKGDTALHRAIRAGDLNKVNLLMDAGASRDIKNNAGQTVFDTLLEKEEYQKSLDCFTHHDRGIQGEWMESAFDKEKWGIVKELWHRQIAKAKVTQGMQGGCSAYLDYTDRIDKAIKYCEKRSKEKRFKRWLPFFTSVHCFNRFSKEEKLGAVKAALQVIWEGKTLSDLAPKYQKALRSGKLKKTKLIDLLRSSNQPMARSVTPLRTAFSRRVSA
jgi:ankyrin repeat protein